MKKKNKNNTVERSIFWTYSVAMVDSFYKLIGLPSKWIWTSLRRVSEYTDNGMYRRPVKFLNQYVSHQ